MQLQLPFFPAGTKLINDCLGFREQAGTVYYLHNGNPIFSHSKLDRNSFHFILANLITHKLCKLHELSKAFRLKRQNIEHYAKALQERGASYFFERKVHKPPKPICYKMIPEKISAIQAELDQGLSMKHIALNHDVSTSAIQYHIRNGNLRKKTTVSPIEQEIEYRI